MGLLFTSSETFSRASMREALDSYYPEDERELDEIVDEAFREIEYRELLLADAYPLRHKTVHVAKALPPTPSLSFAFLLALSAQSFYEETRLEGAGWHEPARLFEHVVTSALRRYLNGRAIRIGTPREQPIPADFAECLAYVGRETSEKTLAPMNPDVGDGDEHCDIVAWAPFADGKPGQAILLVQCAVGKGWKSKLSELSLPVWSGQVDWHTLPTRAFAFPYVLDEDPREWRYISREGGIPFDRLRISQFVRDADLDAPIRRRIRDWCDEFAGKLPFVA